MDRIILEGIEVLAHIGVPEVERATPQKLEIHIELSLDLSRAATAERLSMTVDYAEVHRKILELVAHRPRPLIETVAEEIAHMVLQNFSVQRVDLEVRKFILPNVKSVGVRISREKR